MPAYGRGGAGNLQAINQQTARIAADLEANHASGDNYINSSLPSSPLSSRGQPYSYTGRGGAGNLINSQELCQSNMSATQSTATSRNAEVNAHAVYGRGGAGNQEFSASARESRAARERNKEQLSREQLKAEIERGVEESLAMPARAKVAGKQGILDAL